LIEKARQKLGEVGSVTYQLIDGVLYRSKNCVFPSRCKGVEHFILKLASKLDDFELVLNTYDWPHINSHINKEALPVFSFSKTQYYSDIFYPAWTFGPEDRPSSTILQVLVDGI